ncbi:MAG: hypothetical protein IPH13_11265 [Planctomycetes bacterium]|nr:hypothetical protein [Planctomycetota bacterium]MCC7170818.1 hypothetical protein [Planctomycetota bacterium]
MSSLPHGVGARTPFVAAKFAGAPTSAIHVPPNAGKSISDSPRTSAASGFGAASVIVSASGCRRLGHLVGIY